jgi:6-phosphofructokinase 1
VDEAFAAGKTALEAALAGDTGKMVAFERVAENGGIAFRTKLISLTDVANREKKVPLEWITPEGNHVNEAFLDYAMPLIQGEPALPLECALPRYAKLKKIRA